MAKQISVDAPRVIEMAKLTAKQEMFCREYLIDLNATQAAIRAGYSETSARQVGSGNMSKHDIQELIQKLKAAREEKLEINADWVLQRALLINERCMQHEPVMIKEGDQMVESGEYKFEHAGANKSLELIGKHTSVKCFTDKVELSTPEPLIFNNNFGGKPDES